MASKAEQPGPSHGKESPSRPASDTGMMGQKRGGRKGSPALGANPGLAEARRRGRAKKLNQKSDRDLMTNLQDLDLEAESAVSLGTGLVLDERMGGFYCPWDESFPERPERLQAVQEQLTRDCLLERCVHIKAQPATPQELQLVHSQEYVELMASTPQMTEMECRALSDTYDSVYLHPNSFPCALLATGALLRLVDTLMGGKIRNGLALVRPPGHHAQREKMNGYCMFNNIAIAARYAQEKYHVPRILIVDWDVHHGQGTQFIFEQDPSVLYFSVHRYEQGRFWPHLKASDWSSTGSGKGQGYTVNVPWNQVGMRDGDYISSFLHVLLPIALEFQPQLVLVSAGFDAMLGDPKGEMAATPGGFAHLTHLLMSLAKGKLILSLEGGYNLHSLALGVSATLQTLLGDPCPMLATPCAPCPSALTSLSHTLAAQRPSWKVIQGFQSVPEDKEEKHREMNLGPLPTLEALRKPLEPTLSLPPNRTGLVYDERMMKHFNMWDSYHPERPERIAQITQRLADLGLTPRCLSLPARSATDQELLSCHSKKYVDRVRATSGLKPRELHREGESYNSIYISPFSFSCAQLAAGAACRLVEAILAREVQNGLAIVRPPGHHAERDTACGFCFFNSVAVAARHAQEVAGRALRILIVDWDIHHGNGTQQMFEEDPSVLYISLHRHDQGAFFPMTEDGASSCVGRGRGEGFNVNVAWNGPRLGDPDYLTAMLRIVMPIAYEFNPELVLVSAGFDAARGDPLGGCLISPEGYAHMTHLLMGLAGGRIALVLEGGYNLTSISESMAACTRTLLGDPVPVLPWLRPPLPGAFLSMAEVAQIHRKYWQSLRLNVEMEVEERNTPLELVENSPLEQKIPKEKCSEALATSLKLEERPPFPVLEETLGLESLQLSSQEESPEDPGLIGEAAGGGGSAPLLVVADQFDAEGATFYAVTPLSWCPHLVTVCSVPKEGLDVTQPCQDCGTHVENWLCLSCYQVHCGRYIQAHMLQHHESSDHSLVLSYTDFSAWCYICQAYVNHEILLDAKKTAYQSKFGEEMPMVP
ncbi:protein deacetylase HDAC6 isoform X2 [Macrotis lagotis]|uniref:protein deacetylase HDAC6 isoform X2 n=1 Tax=Macrotis lagotis TaxID=92651 RepID=UPI003D686BE0